MVERTLQNHWIAGRRRPSESGATFEVGGEVGGFERWSRARAEDVQAALTSNAIAAARWGAMSRARRHAALMRVAQALDPDHIGAALEVDLDLDPGEGRERFDEDHFRFVEALEILREGENAEGVGVFGAHWSDWVGGIGARLATHLLAGQTVLVLSDPRLPRAAQFLALACEAAELDDGVINVLHADGREARETAFASVGLAFVRWKEDDQRLDELLHRNIVRVGTTSHFWRATNVSRCVFRDADPVLEAQAVVRSFLGRSSTISGQYPGSTARVLCHERLFARFTEELLGQLEVDPDVVRPVPFLDADQEDFLRHVWSLGLDEGATPIFGAPPSDRGDGDASEGARGLVFTNVDPRSGFARTTRPSPVLGLMRVADDLEARELQFELDGPPKRDSHVPRA